MSLPRFFRPLTRGASRSRSVAPLLVAIIGVALSITFFLLIRAAESKLLQRDLVIISRARSELLKASILRSSEVLYALRDFHQARGSLPRAEFDSLANDGVRRQPELTALEWIPRIPHDQREAVESEMRASGYRNFQFTALTADHALSRAPDAAEYFPVLYIEPLAPNLPAAGLDLYSNPERRAALENARDTGQMCATSPIKLAQDSVKRPGFLMLLPVYTAALSNIPNPTVEDRRNNLAGFALAVFHIEALAAASLVPPDPSSDDGLNIRVIDSTGRSIFQYLTAAPAPSKMARPFYTSSSGISDSVPINIAGQSWQVTFDATPAFAARRLCWIAWTVLLTCSSLTAALTMYLIGAMRRTALIERHVARRTSQLSTEIIERRRAAEAARAAEEKYRSIVENAVEGIFQTTPDGHYLSANIALAHIYGYDSTDALVASLSDIAGQLYVDPGRREAFVQIMQAHDTVTEFESRVRRRNGTSIWISENARAVRDITGRLLYYEGTVIDISARKAAEDALRRAHDELDHRVRERTFELHAANTALQSEVEIRKDAEARAESASRAKSAFLANLSHEIRTPMNAVLGYAQILARDPALPPQHRDAVASIRHSGEHLLGVLNDILDLSKIEAGRMQLRAAGFSLTTCMQAVIAMFRARADEKNLRLILDQPAGEFHVLGDEGKLRQILVNLVGNAVKFTEHGAVSLSVHHALGDTFTFDVRDTGPGIRTEDQKLIFEPFLQSETAITAGGTGLGLAIARQHVRLMGGTLQLDSTPGQGAHFHFTLRLPVTESALAPEQSLSTATVREWQANLSSDPAISIASSISDPILPIDSTLYDALLSAVDLFSVTHFRAALDRLAHDSPQHAALVTRLTARLRRCDFPALRQLLATHAPPETPVSK